MRDALPQPSTVPCNLYSLIARIHSSLFSDWRRTVPSKFLDTRGPLLSTEESVVPRDCGRDLSRIRYNGHSFLLNSYFSRIVNPSCSVCGLPTQHTCNFILHCPASDFLHLLLFGNFFSLFDFWGRP